MLPPEFYKDPLRKKNDLRPPYLAKHVGKRPSSHEGINHLHKQDIVKSAQGIYLLRMIHHSSIYFVKHALMSCPFQCLLVFLQICDM
jgi:hypothetical protein